LIKPLTHERLGNGHAKSLDETLVNNSPLRRHAVRYIRIAFYFLDLGILSFDVHRRSVVVYSNIV
jgi:hypothetical protein